MVHSRDANWRNTVMTEFYNEKNSTEATRNLRNRLHHSKDVCLRGIAQRLTDDQLLLLQALVEWFIARRVVTALLEAGYLLSVWNGEETTVKHGNDRAVLISALMTTDEDRILVYHTDCMEYGSIGWVYLVYGNDGWDVVSDYTTNLEDVLKPVFDLIDQIEPQ